MVSLIGSLDTGGVLSAGRAGARNRGRATSSKGTDRHDGPKTKMSLG